MGRILRLNLLLCKYSMKDSSTYCAKKFMRCFSKWDIVGAICLERKPVITQELLPLEKKYFAHMQQVEFEKSYLSDHEMQHIEDLQIVEKLKKGDIDDVDKTLKQTAQDFEDSCQEELSNFKLSGRITDADVKNDQKSIQRKLDHSLYLIVKQKLGNNHQWIFPQASYLEGETLRQTAERALRSICKDNLKIRVLGNAPFGFYKYKYPKVVRENGACGAKVFYYKAHLLKRNFYSVPVKIDDHIADYCWVTVPELKNIFKTLYYKSVEPFLLFEQNETDEEIDANQTKSTAIN